MRDRQVKDEEKASLETHTSTHTSEKHILKCIRQSIL